MKLLLDACVWGGAVAPLRVAGLDVIWVGEWPNDPGDEQNLRMAVAESRVLVTLDKDFGQMIFVRDSAHCGIIRLVNIAARSQAAAILHVLRTYPSECVTSILTVEPGRVRIRTNGKVESGE